MKTKIVNKLMLTVVLLSCVLSCAFVSCKKDDADNTTKLEAFGPCPVLRGDTLQFIGLNLDKVTSIILPNNQEITDFVKKTSNQIDIIVPQTAVPGYVTLKAPSGDITTITKLSFSEPISISNFSPATVLAGDKLTIEGDYLNLIAQVIFSSNVAVDSADFVSQSRSKIVVTVPKEAQTGKFQITNGAETPTIVYSASSLTVTQPTITAVSPNPAKAGSTVTITGTNFQLVKSLTFNSNLSVTDFTVSADKKTITATVPAKATDGIVTLVTYSGVEVSSAALTLVAPTIASIAPSPVKPGTDITITGTDLDLVTSVVFADGSTGTIATQSATQITLKVPLTATSGSVTLNTNSGKTATGTVSLISPTITSFDPTTVTAGKDITITGTDLDLVTSVVFADNQVVSVSPSSATSFTVTVPSAAVSGKFTLTTSNGTTVTSADALTVESANIPVITSVTSQVKPGGLMTITGTKLNLVESIYFQNNVKAVLYGVRTENTIEVYVPETAKAGTVTLTLNTFDGKQVVSPSFKVVGTDPVTDESLVIFDFEDRNGNNSANNAGGWGGIANGKSTAGDGVSGDFFEITASNWNSGAYWWVADNWVEKPYPTISGTNNYVIKMDIRLRQDIPVDEQLNISLRMSGNTNINIIPYIPVDNNKYSTGGDWVTITIPTTGLQDPTLDSGDWGIVKNWNPNNVNFTGFCVDNIRYEKISGSSGAPAFRLMGF